MEGSTVGTPVNPKLITMTFGSEFVTVGRKYYFVRPKQHVGHSYLLFFLLPTRNHSAA
jgi:hypothetical protein